MFTSDRTTQRRFYQAILQKCLTNELITDPLEQQIANILLEHPEYHAVIEADSALNRDFHPELGETNPFMHLGMHLALCEQLATNRPAGVRQVYDNLCQQQARHDVEHKMMEVLGAVMWQAQRDGTTPDESAYLEALQGLVVNGELAEPTD